MPSKKTDPQQGPEDPGPWVADVGGNSLYGVRFERGDPLPDDVGEELGAQGYAHRESPAIAGSSQPGDDEKGAD